MQFGLQKYGTNTKDELGKILQGDAFQMGIGAKDFLHSETTEDDTTLNIKKYSTNVKLDISNAIGDSALASYRITHTGFYSCAQTWIKKLAIVTRK